MGAFLIWPKQIGVNRVAVGILLVLLQIVRESLCPMIQRVGTRCLAVESALHSKLRSVARFLGAEVLHRTLCLFAATMPEHG